MKADRILVVMNGEIIEEGSHDDLIHSRGKYHDLWSKQVFVKPATDRSRSQSPKKRGANIINDLTPNRSKTELAKVLKTTAHQEPSNGSQAQDSDEAAKDAGKKSENGHQREVSENLEWNSHFLGESSDTKPTKCKFAMHDRNAEFEGINMPCSLRILSALGVDF